MTFFNVQDIIFLGLKKPFPGQGVLPDVSDLLILRFQNLNFGVDNAMITGGYTRI
jgi:hypothetical protein